MSADRDGYNPDPADEYRAAHDADSQERGVRGGDDWVPEDAVEALKMERSVKPDETDRMTAERVFRENLPQAAMAIVHLAIHSASEKIRMDAAKYIVERNLGKPDSASQLAANEANVAAKWEALIAEAVEDASVPNN